MTDQTVRVPREPDAMWILAQAENLSGGKDQTSIKSLAWNLRTYHRRLCDAAAPSPEAEGAGEREALIADIKQCHDQRLSCAAATPSGAGAYVEISTVPADLLLRVLASLQRPQTTAELSGNPGELDDTIARIHALANGEEPAPDSGLVDRLVADIDAEMAGRQRGYADVRGELLFRCREALAQAQARKGAA